jgi:hypothetical protein
MAAQFPNENFTKDTVNTLNPSVGQPTTGIGGTFTMTGGRGLLYLPNQSGKLVLAGVFESVSRTRGLGTEAIHTLGQYSAREIVITSYNEVQVNCSGFRVVGAGTTVLGNFPTLAELIGYSGVTIKVVDRQTGVTTMVVTGCIPTTDSDNYSAKATTKTSISYTGIAAFDEATVDSSGNPTDGEGTPSWTS